jgi:hypothetical protein
MKKIFIISGMMLALFGCTHTPNNDCLPDGWLPMPQEKIKSYFLINENDVVTYISENNETVSFRCYTTLYDYYPYCEFGNEEETPETGPSLGLPCESCRDFIRMECTSNSNKLDFSLDIYENRSRLVVAYSIGYNTGNTVLGTYGLLEKWFENDNKKDRGMGYAKYPNEFMEYLTDTIELRYRESNELMGILVSGVGLAWFTDYNGVKWYLQE